jgi:hypothetical protein
MLSQRRDRLMRAHSGRQNWFHFKVDEAHAACSA